MPLFFFSFLLPNSFQSVSPLPSAFDGRVGTVILQPEVSAGVVVEAILLDSHVPVQDTCVHLHLLHGGTEELEEMKQKPRRDIQEALRENKCLSCLFCRQNANIGFSEVYKVAKEV